MKFGKKQLVLASLVLALGAAVYLNWQFAGTGRLPVGDSSSETSQLGAAQLVNNTYVETVNDGAESGEASGDALAQARIDRQNSRDQALELLDGVLEDGSLIPLVEASDNHQRRCVHDLDAEVCGVRLTLIDTWGLEQCGVFSFDVSETK